MKEACPRDHEGDWVLAGGMAAMTTEEARTLRINEAVIWAAADDRGYRHDLKGRVLRITNQRIGIALTDNTHHVVSPRYLRRENRPLWLQNAEKDSK
jgi:hypothetical protein